MFIGHFALAFAARPWLPAVSLGTLIVAAQLADLAWPIFVLAGLERFEVRPGITAVTPLDFTHYPWSHSLAALVGWGIAFGAGYLLARRGQWKSALAIAALVVSHWVLDVIAHRPDMPVVPGGELRLGLGLWDSVAATLVVEGALFVACVVFYAMRTRGRDKVGCWAFAGFLVFLLAIYAGAVFGPPPPSVEAVVWSDNLMWLLVAWGYWIDRHREMA